MENIHSIDWDKGVILSENKLRTSLKATWTGVPLWAKEVDGRKAKWYVFGALPQDDTYRAISGRVLRSLLRDLKGCRIEEIRLNGSLEMKWINEGGLPGWARIRFTIYPAKIGYWHKIANIPLKEVMA